MSRQQDSEIRRKWFTIGVAISLSAATFASPIGTSMDLPWRLDANGKPVPIDYALPDTEHNGKPDQRHSEHSKLSTTPWSGPWWRTKVGGVAVRWRVKFHNENDALTYVPHPAAELAAMSDDDITNLSAIEKLDIVSGHTDPAASGYYQNLASVRAFVKDVKTKYPKTLGYHGLCAGFSSASLWLTEPNAVRIPATILVNDQAITLSVNFGSGDMKALGTYWYATALFNRDWNWLRTHATDGSLLAGESWDSDSDIYGGIVGGKGALNPAQVHLLLTNLVWNGDQGFAMDIQPGDEVWNFPVTSYVSTFDSSKTIPADADSRAVKGVHVSTRIFFMGESMPVQDALGSLAYTPNSGDFFKLFTRDYSYSLELTADNKIVGGSWDADSDRPDFAWTLRRAIPFTGDYAIIGQYWR